MKLKTYLTTVCMRLPDYRVIVQRSLHAPDAATAEKSARNMEAARYPGMPIASVATELATDVDLTKPFAVSHLGGL